MYNVHLLHLSRGPALLQSPSPSSCSSPPTHPLTRLASRQFSLDIDLENSRRGEVTDSSKPARGANPRLQLQVLINVYKC